MTRCEARQRCNVKESHQPAGTSNNRFEGSIAEPRISGVPGTCRKRLVHQSAPSARLATVRRFDPCCHLSDFVAVDEAGLRRPTV